MTDLRLSFLAVGPQRSGTTWIDEYLRPHADVELPHGVKETFFLDKYWDRGLSWYSQRFAGAASKVRGEVAPSYFHAESAPRRAKEAFGPLTIVATMREPLARLESLYFHRTTGGLIPSGMSFRAALYADPELLASARYHENAERWVAAHGVSNLRFLRYELLENDPVQFSKEVSAAIGIPWREPGKVELARVNASQVPSSMFLARRAKRITRFMRKHDLHGLVNLAKRTRLKPFLLGGSEGRPSLPPEDLTVALETLRPDLEAFCEKFNFDPAPWARVWKARGIES